MSRQALLPTVLRERDYRLYFAGRVTSTIGTTMAPVAITFAVLGEGHGAGEVGLVLMAGTIPLVLLVLLGGVLADRLSPRLVMVAADALRLVAHGTLAALLLLGHPPLWQFVVAEVVVGIGDALFSPANTGLLPQIVRTAQLQQANALLGVSQSVARIVGPATAGVLVATVGPGWAVAVDAATYAASGISLVWLHVAATVRTSSARFLAQFAEGWREFTSRTWLWTVVAQASIFLMLGYAPFLVVGAVVADQSYGGAGAWGAVLAAEGVGAVAAGVVLLRVHVSRPLLVSILLSFLQAVPIALLAMQAPLLLVIVAALAAGTSSAAWNTLWQTVVQREIPEAVLSRVSAYDWLGSVALLPVGFALVGPLTDWLGLSGTLWLAAAAVTVSTAAMLSVGEVRTLHYAAPEPEPAAPVGSERGRPLMRD